MKNRFPPRNSRGLTLKVLQTNEGWVWRIITDHNGEAIAEGQDRYVSQQEAKEHGLYAWQAIRTG